MLDRVPHSNNANIVDRQAIITDGNSLLFTVTVITGLVVVLCSEDKEGSDNQLHGVDRPDQRCSRSSAYRAKGLRNCSDAIITFEDPPKLTLSLVLGIL
jgi:hypothetical protein